MNKYLISFAYCDSFDRLYEIDSCIEEWDKISEENIKEFRKNHFVGGVLARIIAITKLDE